MEVNQDMCETTGKTKKRKGDLYTYVILQLYEKFGNATYNCPVKKV